MSTDDVEAIRTSIPGPLSLQLRAGLQRYESRNVAYLADDFPVFWESAQGAVVTDVDGNRYLDLTSAFGVANVGHTNPYVVSAIADQASRLVHGMGDVHPTEARSRLLERLVQILPTGLDKAFLSTTGSEAVEAAMKTAVLATGKPAFAAFAGGYHGLSLGALELCGIEKFRTPFAEMLPNTTLLLEYPRAGATSAAHALAAMRDRLRGRSDIAAMIVEPIQGRGGCIVPPSGWLPGLRTLCDELHLLLIFDEIYTGFGRTGSWFAAQHEDVVPDIICVGKALGGGFPISATVARGKIMDAWPLSSGEALHTSTYLGNPMGAAAALATIGELERGGLVERAERLGVLLGERLAALRRLACVREVRGRGLLWGIELANGALAARVVAQALALGVITLQSGPTGNVLVVAPPLVIGERQLDRAIDLLERAIAQTEAL
ncbi:MAG: aspartate aminotransferase family protein [Vulcanimicrobiaceae bacterium]